MLCPLLDERVIAGWRVRSLLGTPVSELGDHPVQRVQREAGTSLGQEVREVALGVLALAVHALGILILEGYGLVETCPILTANRGCRFRFGPAGVPAGATSRPGRSRTS